MSQLEGQVIKKVLKQQGPKVVPILKDRKVEEGEKEKRKERERKEWRLERKNLRFGIKKCSKRSSHMKAFNLHNNHRRWEIQFYILQKSGPPEAQRC